MKKKIAIVTPRYGATIGGGAETAARGFAEEAVRQGWQIEIWTTCATSHITWENILQPGCEIENGVTVRRFKISLPRPEEYIHKQIDGTKKLADDNALPSSYNWITYGPHSPDMYQYIHQHGKEFSAILIQPYTYSAANYATWIHPERTLVWPCLHHEIQAYSEPIRLFLEGAHAVLFNAPEEQELATKHLGFKIERHANLGVGVELDPLIVDSPQYAIPHLVYVGRLELAKNVPEMYQFTQRYAETVGDIQLTVAGTGPIEPPDLPYIDYRGFVSDEEKAQLMASATAHWLPSISESFSIVTMESWLSGRPVLVNCYCDVPAGHVQRSKAGLAYGGFWEFAGAVQWLQENPQLADRMGQNGKHYVEQNYRWPIIIKRFEALATKWMTT